MKSSAKKSSPQIAADLLSQENKSLHAIFMKLAQLKPLNRLLQNCLGPEMSAHCQVAAVKGDCLVIIIDNAHWATYLRFQAPEILAKFRTYPGLQGLKTIRHKVRPLMQNETEPTSLRPELSLSSANATLLAEAAENIADEKLRAVLKKIAGNAKSKSSP